MNLNSHRKEIIKRIVSGEIYDIYSFLVSFNLLDYYKLDIEEVKKRFNEEENGKFYKIPNKDGDFERKRHLKVFKNENVDFDENDFKYVKARYRIDTPGYIVKFNDKEYKFSFANKGIWVAKKYSDILEFVTLWQQLQDRGLIFEIDKEIKLDDISIFYEIFPTNETCYYKQMISERESNIYFNQENIPQNYERIPTYDCYEDLQQYGVSIEYFWDERGRIEKNELSYCERYPVFNELHIATCKDYIGKKFVASPMLKEYVANHFQTVEEKKSRWSLIGTWFAILISLVMAIFSIFATFKVDPSNDNLVKIQEQLKQIQSDIGKTDQELIEEVLLKIEEIDFSKYDDVELQDKLDSIIKILEEITE